LPVGQHVVEILAPARVDVEPRASVTGAGTAVAEDLQRGSPLPRVVILTDARGA
jgi:hypothetical protein